MDTRDEIWRELSLLKDPRDCRDEIRRNNLGSCFFISEHATIVMCFKHPHAYACVREKIKWAAYLENENIPGFICIGTDFYNLQEAKELLLSYRVDEAGNLYKIEETT